MSVAPLAQALKTLWHATAVDQDSDKAKSAQKTFIQACEKQGTQKVSEVSEQIPLSRQVKGITHLAMGDTKNAVASREAITRTGIVLGHGAWQNIGTMPILGGVVTGDNSDALLIDRNDYKPHCRYNPGDSLGAMHGCEPGWRGCIFDAIIVSVGNLELTSDDPKRREYRTTKVFRVEGESTFLDEDGALRFEAHGRLFSGIGGSIIKTPRVAQIAHRPEGEAAPVQLKNSVFYLVSRDATRKEECNCPRVREYRDAIDELKRSSKSYPALRRLEIKSFRVITSSPDCMYRHIPRNLSPSTNVIRIDISKTSSGCLRPLCAPIIERVPPCTYGEPYCAWLTGVPPRLKRHMYHQHVKYGCVRTYVIAASTFSESSLDSKIAEKITAQELNRLSHAPVSVSSLSQAGINSIEVRFEPVVRLRQTREVKCSRQLIGETFHGRYTEYLAEFGDGSTSWIPSCNVADDLKQEFWDVITTGAEEVTTIISSDPVECTLTVKRADGREESVSQTQIFWQSENSPTMLSDVELEAILHHAHYGADYTDFIPCKLFVEADWARAELRSYGTIIMEDPAAAKAGEYVDVQSDGRSLQLSEPFSFEFNSRTIPFLIASNGAPFDINVIHGKDNGRGGHHDGRAVLTVGDDRFESGYKPAHIRPFIVTPGLLTIEANWGAITVTSADATIGLDPTVDQSVYQGVECDGRSMTQRSGIVGEKFVVPFLLFTRDEEIDIALTHGADKGPGGGDCSGTATAMFGKRTYTSPCDLNNLSTSLKTFKGCRISEHPPMVPR